MYAAVQDPTYAGALDVFARRGAQLVGLPVDPAADLGQALELAANGRDVRVVYVISTFHNPTGTVMPQRQRRQLLAAAAERGAYVVDDEALAALPLDHERPTGLAALDDTDSVVTIGSLSKSCWPGLRIGWIRARPDLIDRLVRVKTVDDLSTSLPSQALAVAVLAEFERIVAQRTAQLVERSGLVCELLARHLPEWAAQTPSGGASLWVRLPVADSLPFVQLALRHGVSILPGSELSVTRSFADHIRIQLLQPHEELEEGVLRLTEAWGEYRRRQLGGVRDLRVVA
jgi:DNA-binding transcriptional MocR family regulator